SPYFEFAVGELSPREQSIAYAQRDGTTVLPIVNKGNSQAAYRLEAEDDQRACSYEFAVPGNATSLARQAELRLPPNMGIHVPIRITPNRRSVFGMRKRRLSVTVTTTPLEGQHSPRS